jgi:6-phosphofructokinase 1
MSKIKRIGVFTSGGDCAGLNFAVSAVVRRCSQLGIEVIGLEDGAEGMMGTAPARKLPISMPWGEIVRQGSTFLGAYSNSNWKFKGTQGKAEVAYRDRETPLWKKTIQKHKLDAIISTSGNGSIFYSAEICAELGMPFIGIPKTLDNDVMDTDVSVGFESTVRFCAEMIDNLFWTAKGHRRVMIAEVMGRHVGHLALHSGLAAGADIILIPEIKYTLEGIAAKLKEVKKNEKRNYALIVVSEGAGGAKGDEELVTSPNAKFKTGATKFFPNVSDYLETKLGELGFHARACKLGHIQRGAATSSHDRKLAQIMGVLAVDTALAMKKPEQKMISLTAGRIKARNIGKQNKIHEKYVDLKSDEVWAAKALGIYIGG